MRSGLPSNNRMNLTALRAARYPERYADRRVTREDAMKGLILGLTLLSLFTGVALGLVPNARLADGQELERTGVTYVLHKTDNGWKIAVTVGHDAESVPRLE